MNGSTRFPLSLLTLQRNYSQANGLGITCVFQFFLCHKNLIHYIYSTQFCFIVYIIIVNTNCVRATTEQEDPFELDSNLLLSSGRHAKDPKKTVLLYHHETPLLDDLANLLPSSDLLYRYPYASMTRKYLTQLRMRIYIFFFGLYLLFCLHSLCQCILYNVYIIYICLDQCTLQKNVNNARGEHNKIILDTSPYYMHSMRNCVLICVCILYTTKYQVKRYTNMTEPNKKYNIHSTTLFI